MAFLFKVVTCWERLTTNLLFVAYGTVSIFRPTASSNAGQAFGYTILFNVEFIVAGMLMTFAVFYPNRILKSIGYSVYLIGWATLAALVLVGTGSPVWMLIGGLFFQTVLILRADIRQRTADAELRALIKEISERQE